MAVVFFFFFKQKTAYEMRISDWSSDVCSSDLGRVGGRKKVMTPKRIEAARKLLASGMSAREIAPTIGVSVATLYRHLPAPEQEAINAEEMERDGAAGASTIKPTE